MTILYEIYVAGMEIEVVAPGLKSEYKYDALTIALTGPATQRKVSKQDTP